jgi:hypothetical protein
MAKSIAGISKVVYNFPSHYGSHSKMIENDEEIAMDFLNKLLPKQLDGIKDPVVLKDEFGNYVTDRNRLDNGLADPNRYVTERLAPLFAGRQKEKDKKGKGKK